MKHVFNIAICVWAAFSVASCNSSQTENNEASQDSATNADTTQVVDSVAIREAQWRADSLAMCQRQTYDLTFFELRGPVKKVKRNGFTYEFSRDGELTKVNGKDPFKGTPYDDGTFSNKVCYHRDKEGRIVNEEVWEGTVDYTWNGDRLIEESGTSEGFSWNYKYSVDSIGNILAIKGVEGETGEESPISYNYTPDKFDSYGNWTVKADKKRGPTFQRTITYYPIKREQSKK